ncbi:XdhC family protein [Halobacterium zhouii]|uniref:XdhC family protein n=1 Tax=Halobacterium zhouii TaxID=2902624 RepID=UPI001E5AB356|nr:XdhC/CoxI family protein [Halobacterium zhouii]
MDRDDLWSVTDRDLHEQLRSLRDAGETAAVATIVGVDGSAYRRPGAKLLAPEDAETLGAITAGCLEGPVADLAAHARTSGEVAVETYDLVDDDAWGLGVGCNGVIDVLVEPLDDSMDPLLDALEDRDVATVLTVVASADDDVPVGARSVLGADGTAYSGDDRAGVPADALDALRDAASETSRSRQVTVECETGDFDVFVDPVEPAPDLVLFGAQNDVHAVARFAREAGFRVTVATARGARADDDAFPHAHRVVATRPNEIVDVVDAPERAGVVVMSHNFVDDRLALEHLLTETSVPYVGLMGPRERFEEMREAFAEEGTVLSAEELDRVATPVGLDLGDGSPTGIALSIVSEALAAANGASGGRLAEQEGPIHERLDPAP